MLQKPALLLQTMKAPGIVLQCGRIHAQKHYLLLPELVRGGTHGRSSLSALPRCYSAVLFQPISVDQVCLEKLGRNKFAFNFVLQSKSRPGCHIYASKGEELDAEWAGHHSSQQDKLIVQSEDEEAESGFIVVNFYYFVEVEDPHHEVAQHTAFMEVSFYVLFISTAEVILSQEITVVIWFTQIACVRRKSITQQFSERKVKCAVSSYGLGFDWGPKCEGR
jgi:hypothetical protein